MSDLALGEHIASGRTAEIYHWKNGYVLKLFNDWVSQNDIEYEAKVARIVFQSGYPSPSVGEIVNVDDRIGLVYGMIDGHSMMRTLCKKPWTFYKYAKTMANLHTEMHAVSLPELPSQRERLIRKIKRVEILSDNLKEKVLALLKKLPDDNKLCHGDFHPDNILISPNEPIIIDWTDASHGNPIADIARTTLLFQIAIFPDEMPRRYIINKIRPWFLKTYLSTYRKIRIQNQFEFDNWLIVNAAARLEENIVEEQNLLLKIVKSGLS